MGVNKKVGAEHKRAYERLRREVDTHPTAFAQGKLPWAKEEKREKIVHRKLASAVLLQT